MIFPKDYENKVICGDCLSIMKGMPDKCVSLVIADPPYYRIANESWDKQHSSIAEYIKWLKPIAIELKRLLCDRGSLFIFGDDRNIAYVQVLFDQYFVFLNHLVLHKTNNLPQKNAANLKSFPVMSERILYYGLYGDRTGLQSIYENPDCFNAIKAYMRQERDALMKHLGHSTLDQFNQYINDLTDTKSVVSRHYFSDSQWVFPTAEIYAKLQTAGYFQREYKGFQREYESLRREYESLRREYEPQKGIHEIIALPIISGNDNTAHPTTKPLALMKILIKSASRVGDLVLDPMCGSGTTAVAAKQLGRRFIGIEINPDYCKIAKDRLANFIDATTEERAQAGLPMNFMDLL